MGHKLHELEQTLTENVAKKMKQGREMVSSGIDQAQDKLSNAQEILVEYAKQHPFHAIGISFIAGLALSQLFTSRND